MVRRQSFASRRRDSGMDLDSRTSSSSLTSARNEAGMGRISRHGAGIYMVRRNAQCLLKKDAVKI